MKWLLLPLLLVSCGAHTEPASVRLEFGTGLCTGTVVAPHTILSAEHCLQGGDLTAVNGVETHAVRVIRDGQDHILLTVDRNLGRGRIRVDTPRQGDTVHWVGNPAGVPNVLRRGYVAAVIEGVTLIDAPGYGGDSGSGIFNDRGALIGVLSGSYTWRNESGSFVLIRAMPLRFTQQDWKAVR